MGFKESLYGLLGVGSAAVPKEVLSNIRDDMLKSLGRYDTTSHPGLFMKIYVADGVEELWNLRPDLLAALKEMLGEKEALQRMDAITEAFIGFHPAAKKRKRFR